jgi:hypothetical protein
MVNGQPGRQVDRRPLPRHPWDAARPAWSAGGGTAAPAPSQAVDSAAIFGTRKTVRRIHYLYQCCGLGMYIPDPNFFHPGSEFFPSRIPDLHQRILVFYPKKNFYALGNMIWVVHPGSGSLVFTHPGSRIQGVKKAPDPGSGSATLNCTILYGMFSKKS